MGPAGSGRLVVALCLLAGLAGLVYWTMQPDRFRDLTLVLLAFFAFRVVLGRLRSR